MQIKFLLKHKDCDLGNQDPVGSPAEVSQTTLATIIANQIPFKAGRLRDCLYVWKTITSDPFILDAVTHCHIEFDWIPGACTSAIRPACFFSEIEQTIINSKVEKFLLKGIIRLHHMRMARSYLQFLQGLRKIGLTGLYLT